MARSAAILNASLERRKDKVSFVQLVATAICSVVLAVWAVWKLVLPGAIEALLRERDAQHARDLEKVKTELEAGIRKLQGQIDRTVLVHRVQFETEFAALRDIWRCVVNARNAVNTMRPMFSLVSIDQNHDDKLKELNERLKPLIEAHNVLAIAIDASAPFYEKELYDAFEGIREVADYPGANGDKAVRFSVVQGRAQESRRLEG
jgi:hypothetical protein